MMGFEEMKRSKPPDGRLNKQTSSTTTRPKGGGILDYRLCRAPLTNCTDDCTTRRSRARRKKKRPSLSTGNEYTPRAEQVASLGIGSRTAELLGERGGDVISFWLKRKLTLPPHRIKNNLPRVNQNSEDLPDDEKELKNHLGGDSIRLTGKSQKRASNVELGSSSCHSSGHGSGHSRGRPIFVSRRSFDSAVESMQKEQAVKQQASAAGLKNESPTTVMTDTMAALLSPVKKSTKKPKALEKDSAEKEKLRKGQISLSEFLASPAATSKKRSTISVPDSTKMKRVVPLRTASCGDDLLAKLYDDLKQAATAETSTSSMSPRRRKRPSRYNGEKGEKEDGTVEHQEAGSLLALHAAVSGRSSRRVMDDANSAEGMAPISTAPRKSPHTPIMTSPKQILKRHSDHGRMPSIQLSPHRQQQQLQQQQQQRGRTTIGAMVTPKGTNRKAISKSPARGRRTKSLSPRSAMRAALQKADLPANLNGQLKARRSTRGQDASQRIKSPRQLRGSTQAEDLPHTRAETGIENTEATATATATATAPAPSSQQRSSSKTRSNLTSESCSSPQRRVGGHASNPSLTPTSAPASLRNNSSPSFPRRIPSTESLPTIPRTLSPRRKPSLSRQPVEQITSPSTPRDAPSVTAPTPTATKKVISVEPDDTSECSFAECSLEGIGSDLKTSLTEALSPSHIVGQSSIEGADSANLEAVSTLTPKQAYLSTLNSMTRKNTCTNQVPMTSQPSMKSPIYSGGKPPLMKPEPDIMNSPCRSRGLRKSEGLKIGESSVPATGPRSWEKTVTSMVEEKARKSQKSWMASRNQENSAHSKIRENSAHSKSRVDNVMPTNRENSAHSKIREDSTHSKSRVDNVRSRNRENSAQSKIRDDSAHSMSRVDSVMPRHRENSAHSKSRVDNVRSRNRENSAQSKIRDDSAHSKSRVDSVMSRNRGNNTHSKIREGSSHSKSRVDSVVSRNLENNAHSKIREDSAHSKSRVDSVVSRKRENNANSKIREESTHSKSRVGSAHSKSRVDSVVSRNRENNANSKICEDSTHSKSRVGSVMSRIRDSSAHSKVREDSTHSKSRVKTAISKILENSVHSKNPAEPTVETSKGKNRERSFLSKTQHSEKTARTDETKKSLKILESIKASLGLESDKTPHSVDSTKDMTSLQSSKDLSLFSLSPSPARATFTGNASPRRRGRKWPPEQPGSVDSSQAPFITAQTPQNAALNTPASISSLSTSSPLKTRQQFGASKTPDSPDHGVRRVASQQQQQQHQTLVMHSPKVVESSTYMDTGATTTPGMRKSKTKHSPTTPSSPMLSSSPPFLSTKPKLAGRVMPAPAPFASPPPRRSSKEKVLSSPINTKLHNNSMMETESKKLIAEDRTSSSSPIGKNKRMDAARIQQTPTRPPKVPADSASSSSFASPPLKTKAYSTKKTPKEASKPAAENQRSSASFKSQIASVPDIVARGMRDTSKHYAPSKRRGPASSSLTKPSQAVATTTSSWENNNSNRSKHSRQQWEKNHSSNRGKQTTTTTTPKTTNSISSNRSDHSSHCGADVVGSVGSGGVGGHNKNLNNILQRLAASGMQM